MNDVFYLWSSYEMIIEYLYDYEFKVLLQVDQERDKLFW